MQSDVDLLPSGSRGQAACGERGRVDGRGQQGAGRGYVRGTCPPAVDPDLTPPIPAVAACSSQHRAAYPCLVSTLMDCSYGGMSVDSGMNK